MKFNKPLWFILSAIIAAGLIYGHSIRVQEMENSKLLEGSKEVQEYDSRVFTHLPNTDEVYRCALGSMDLEDLDSLLATGKINRIIKLYSDSEESAKNTSEDVYQVARKYQVILEEVDSKAGYSKGYGHLLFAHQMYEAIQEDSLVFGCVGNRDRSGEAAAYWLINNGFNKEEILSFNKWTEAYPRKSESHKKVFEILNNL